MIDKRYFMGSSEFISMIIIPSSYIVLSYICKNPS